MPVNWNWLKLDARNIRNIHQRFGNVPLSSHPLISVTGFVWNRYVRNIHWTAFLDYFDYRKDAAVAQLEREIGYRPYPYKHYESVFTRFYQGFILPQKFGVDKRKLHLSTLVMTKQMSREEALEILKQSPYPDVNQQCDDLAFVKKKLGFTAEEFDDYMRSPPTPHDVYGTEKPFWDVLYRGHKLLDALANR